MKSLRLALVIRRYWPRPGGMENVATRLCGELARRGHRAVVFTPRAQSDWPATTVRGGVEIVRPEPSGGGWWGEWRYLGRLERAFRVADAAEPFDAAVVSGLRGEAYAIGGVARQLGVPWVLQPERPGLSGDCHWQLEARFGSRVKRRCYEATAYLALTPLLERELIAAGYARPRIHRVALGVPLPEPAEAATRAEARRNLATADPALTVGAEQRLVVYVGRLRVGKGIDTLLSAWRRVVERSRDAMLWLVGEGPDAAYLRERVFELGLVHRVRLTGAFDDVEDVFRAADAAVYPSPEDGLAVGLLEAASYGLPIVASDVVTHRDFLAAEREARFAVKHDVDSLAAALLETLDDATSAQSRGTAARRRVAADHSLERMGDDYERVLAKIVDAARRPVPREMRR